MLRRPSLAAVAEWEKATLDAHLGLARSLQQSLDGVETREEGA